MPDRFRLLLLWPGGLFSQSKSFGVPQLLSLASAVRSDDVRIDVVDLDMERAFGPIDFERILAPGYDLVGLSCYSSYDYLKVMAIAARIRKASPRSKLVTGGYHPSARPEDFTRDGSPFDYVIVGDGENPLRRLVGLLLAGKEPDHAVLPTEPLERLDALPPVDWALLERYRPVARKRAAQAEIYLSRGCPFSCAFCMERAKRCTTWRAFDPSRAIEELHRLDAFLDLSSWSLFVTDALFGLSKSWRRSFLEGLARRPIRARKIWLLARADLLEREDLAMMARANVAPGFGLESGSPEQLARIQKAGSAHAFLDHMIDVVRWARELDLPFGANVIVGHPGETESTLRESAAYLEKLFLENSHTTGFLSVDPFRLYPGSAIDRELDSWMRSTGFRVHRYPWWEDGDQDFLSEWVEPSFSLDFRTTLRLRNELFGPILRAIPSRFQVGDPEAAYFHRSIDEQVSLLSPRRQLRTVGLWHLWRELTGREQDTNRAVREDGDLAKVARLARDSMLSKSRIEASPIILEALRCVPRERFVRVEDLGSSADDRALVLVETGEATISAPHAYALSFGALDLDRGDSLVDLGGGTGYGAALAAYVVGGQGRVKTIEIDDRLCDMARENLEELDCVRVIGGDAHDVDLWRGARKVTVGFAVERIPEPWVEALAVGGKMVVPVGAGVDQALTLVERLVSGDRRRVLARVRYVADRG